MFYSMDLVMQVGYLILAPIHLNVGFTIIGVFSPVAGLLTDIKFSRHRAVLFSSFAIAIKFLVVCLTILT